MIKVRKDEVRKNEVRINEVQKNEVRKDEVRKDEVRKDEVRKDEVRKIDSEKKALLTSIQCMCGVGVRPLIREPSALTTRPEKSNIFHKRAKI